MAINYLNQVEEALRATVIKSPRTFSWFGKTPRHLPKALTKALPPEILRNVLLETLQEQLYVNFYCKGFAAPLSWDRDTPHNLVSRSPLIDRLSNANVGSGYWNCGWTVTASDDGRIIVSQSGLDLRVRPGDCQTDQDEPIVYGSSVRLRFPKEFTELSPGFYVAASDIEFTKADRQSIARLYWNLLPSGAVRLMHGLTTALNGDNIPFQLKVLKDLTTFTRCDSAVLYIRKADYGELRKTFVSLYYKICNDMRSGTPVFTKQLAPGLGLAEEPPGADSFGLHRCRILAHAMIRAHLRGKESVKDQLAIVEEVFAIEHLNLERPFLNAGSEDIYALDLLTSRTTRRKFSELRSKPTRSRDRSLLEVSYSIGRRLCHEALWQGQRCSWVGASKNDQNVRTYSSLGSDLYSGTSGVGLFLAELHALTGDSALRRTALGAITHALARADDIPFSYRLGLFTGWPGIALAAARIGMIWRSNELLDAAGQLIRRTMSQSRATGQLDLMSGNAGAIVALLAAHRMLNEDECLEFCEELGRELMRTAVNFRDGCSWRTINAVDEYHLTGLAHGTSGIGLALLQLFQVTGKVGFRRLAQSAFNYERHWFDAKMKNWPDLRESSVRRKAPKHSLAFSTFWCHGAPGIALSRLRAYEALREEECKMEALTALQTTRKMIEAFLYSPNSNFALCHGLAGNAEVMLIGSEILGQDFPIGSNIARQVGISGVAMYASSEGDWPCGIDGSPTPGLMLGIAGIGHFYLRLHQPSVPSILSVSSEGVGSICNAEENSR